MQISVFAGADISTIATAIDRTREAAAAGASAIWFPQTARCDALTAIAVAASRVPDIGVATAVVPIQGRHPVVVALQALTAADAAGPGRLTLGLGVTHAPMSEQWFGVPYRGIVEQCAEHVTALARLLGPERSVAMAGRHVSADVALGSDVPAPGIVLAALGPRMLRLAGRLTDGTVTWMTGPRTIARAVAPVIADAAAAAGRPAPRVVVGLPVVVTDDERPVRARLARQLEPTARLASYARALAAERLSDAGEVALVGNETAVAEELDAIAAAGATEFLANISVAEPHERERTLAFLGTRRPGR